jgi:hypothetical protein
MKLKSELCDLELRRFNTVPSKSRSEAKASMIGFDCSFLFAKSRYEQLSPITPAGQLQLPVAKLHDPTPPQTRFSAKPGFEIKEAEAPPLVVGKTDQVAPTVCPSVTGKVAMISPGTPPTAADMSRATELSMVSTSLAPVKKGPPSTLTIILAGPNDGCS